MKNVSTFFVLCAMIAIAYPASAMDAPAAEAMVQSEAPAFPSVCMIEKQESMMRRLEASGCGEQIRQFEAKVKAEVAKDNSSTVAVSDAKVTPVASNEKGAMIYFVKTYNTGEKSIIANIFGHRYKGFRKKCELIFVGEVMVFENNSNTHKALEELAGCYQ